MKKLVIVGAGHRCYSFAKRIIENYSDRIVITGVCDVNVKRCEYYRDTLSADIKIYRDFDLMLNRLKPDAVFVTVPDCMHHEYIVRSLKKGCNVYTEKPITVDEEKCFEIRRAEKETGKKVSVLFNCRFMPYFAKLKEIVLSGVIGKPLAINYDYVLNTEHGGDYFKRWHRFMKNSGGMLVHKATHHFDIVNWLLNDDPVYVSAQGARLYFGNDDRPHGENCRSCDYKNTCVASGNMYDEEFIRKMYYEAEGEDGYVRDHCVFKNDTDIYDSMSVSVTYKKGTVLTYTLNLFNTDEGYTLNIIGENGRIEASTFFKGDKYKIIVYDRKGQTNEITFPKETGDHAGGDDRLTAMVFGEEGNDLLGQCSDSYDGIKSALIGISANKSIKEGVRINLTPILEELK